MSRLVIDIETNGFEFEALDVPTQDYMMRWAKTDEEVKEVKETLSFYPITAEVVAIGMLNPDSQKGVMHYQAPGEKNAQSVIEEDGIKYESGTEAEILAKFWETVKQYDTIVTYNGRGFDCPFLLVRSAVHKIKPTKDLMPNRYSGKSHIDLMDQLSFYGASRKKFSLDMWCRAFGITSPKDKVMGYQVPELFKAGKYMDIARYCAKDIKATSELLSRWETYMRY